ncbi:MAG: response regulator [Alphaproteobacteria bacterium]|nr:response regulator [Alphaproteobacteria bacterium]
MTSSSEEAILVVDDIASMRQVIRTCLNQLGYFKVDEACDGDEAMAKAREKKYSWILSDWHMRPMGGAELAEKLRDEFGDDMPRVVFLTMDGDWNVMNLARDLGAVRLIVKPLRPSSLKASIGNVLRAA